MPGSAVRNGLLLTALAAAVTLGLGCGGSDPPKAGLNITGYAMGDTFRSAATAGGRPVPARGVVVQFFNDPAVARSGLKDWGPQRDEAGHSDVIVTMDGRPVSAAVLNEPLAGRKPGDTVTLHVWSADGTQRDVTVPLTKQKPTSKGGYFPGG